MPSSTRPRAAGVARDRTGMQVWWFVIGVLLVTVGVLLHLPDMAMMLNGGEMAGTGEMAGMAMWTPTMTGGMLLLVVGLTVSGVALVRGTPRARPGARASLDVIDHGKLRPAHWLTFGALVVALVEDIMKPLTLGFVLPGMSQEYDMSLAAVSLLPLVALIGTAVGSVVWGMIADRYGRRPAFLLAVLLFTATAVCGAMPTFEWNLAMCFAMGTSAGGLLPLAFTLAAELTSRRHRGWIAVLLGGVGGLGGYVAASGAAHYLEPVFGWRVLWLVGLPSGLLLLAMTPLIPESPLYLLRAGRRAEAELVLSRYGGYIHPAQSQPAPTGPTRRPSVRALLRAYPRVTTVIVAVGIVWGLVNFGFLVMLPTQLRDGGMDGGAASGLLTRSALYSTPALGLVVLLYAYWSGRRSLAVCVAAAASALVVVAVWSISGLGDGLLVVAVGTLVLAQSAINAMLLPYSAEVYPTELRATGTGLAAAATKAGGIVGPSAMVLMLTVGGGLHIPALILAVLGLVAAMLMLRFGSEVGQRHLGSRRAGVPAEQEMTPPTPAGEPV